MKSRELFDYSVKSNGIIKLSIKDVDTTKRTITGVGNAYNFMDTQLDVVMPGAAKKSIQEKGPDSQSVAKIKHALNHDLTQLPGKMTMLCEKEVNIKGENVMCLCFESKLSDTTLGNDTLTNYLDGIYDNHSIGFKYLKYKFLNPNAHGNSEEGKEWSEFKDSIINLDDYAELSNPMMDWYGEDGGKVLKVDEINLFEISTVAFGANSLTPYLGNKSAKQTPETILIQLHNRLKKLQSTIKNGTQSDDMMNVILLQIDQLKSLHDEIFTDLQIKAALEMKYNPEKGEDYNELLDKFSL